jgi:type IV pilus assembly protein PilQ
VSKVPLLGDVPVLGYLFKTQGRESTKTELLVFITPKIVADRMTSAR